MEMTKQNIQDSLKSLIATIGRQDFGDCKIGVLQVKILDNLQDVASREGFHLKSIELGNFIYTGAHWEEISFFEMQDWLHRVAERMGVTGTIAKQFRFVEGLAKQFVINFGSIRKPTNKNLINLINGTFDTASFTLLRHNPEDDFLYTLPFNYDAKAICPQFNSYLSEVLPDKTSRIVLQEYIGYIFLNIKLEKVAILYGSGANGKSVFLDIITALLGKENISNISMANLTREDGRYTANIATTLLNICTDISNVINDSAIFKAMASGEAINAKPLYKDSYKLEEYAKLIFACNELPNTIDYSDGFFRRFLIINFPIQIEKEKQDPELANKIISNELSGILNWVIEGITRLKSQKHFTASDELAKTLEEYRQGCDSVAMFLSEERWIMSANDRFLLKKLYQDFCIYCDGAGYKRMTRNKFSDRLRILKYNLFTSTGNLKYVNVKKDYS